MDGASSEVNTRELIAREVPLCIAQHLIRNINIAVEETHQALSTSRSRDDEVKTLSGFIYTVPFDSGFWILDFDLYLHFERFSHCIAYPWIIFLDLELLFFVI